jgi:hypothetical protein
MYLIVPLSLIVSAGVSQLVLLTAGFVMRVRKPSGWLLLEPVKQISRRRGVGDALGGAVIGRRVVVCGPVGGIQTWTLQ